MDHEDALGSVEVVRTLLNSYGRILKYRLSHLRRQWIIYCHTPDNIIFLKQYHSIHSEFYFQQEPCLFSFFVLGVP